MKAMSTKEKAAYHHGNLAKALVEAATRLVNEQGPAYFAIADACRLAGVSKGAPYRHFASRDALLQEVAFAGFDRLETAMLAAIEDLIPGSDERITALGLAYIRFAIREPEIFRLMVSHNRCNDDSGEDFETRRYAYEILLAEVKTRTGYTQLKQLMRVARPLWTLVHGASMLTINNNYQRIDPEGDTDRMVRETTKLILAPYPEPAN